MLLQRVACIVAFVAACALAGWPASADQTSQGRAKTHLTTEQVHGNTVVPLNVVTSLSGRDRLRGDGARISASKLRKIGVGTGRTSEGTYYIWNRGMLEGLTQRGFKAMAKSLGFTHAGLRALERQVKGAEVPPGQGLATEKVHGNTKVSLAEVSFPEGHYPPLGEERVSASKLWKRGVGVGRTADGKLYLWDRGLRTEQIHGNTKVPLNDVAFLSGDELLPSKEGRISASKLKQIGVGVGRTADGVLYMWNRGILESFGKSSFKDKAARLGFTEAALNAIQRQVEVHDVMPGTPWHEFEGRVSDMLDAKTAMKYGHPLP